MVKNIIETTNVIFPIGELYDISLKIPHKGLVRVIIEAVASFKKGIDIGF